MKKINLFILAVVCAFAFACGGNANEENNENEMTTDEVEQALENEAENVEKQAEEALENAEENLEEVSEDIKEGAEEIKEEAKNAVDGHEGHGH